MTPERRVDEGERRRCVPGRRASDEDREIIATAVREEIKIVQAESRRSSRRLGGLWLGVWLLTLAMTSVAWHVASNANDRSATAAATASGVAHDAARNAQVAREQTRAACERTRIFGPDLADAYAKYKILGPASLKAYRDGLPTRC